MRAVLWVFRKSYKISAASDQYFLIYVKKLQGGMQMDHLPGGIWFRIRQLKKKIWRWFDQENEENVVRAKKCCCWPSSPPFRSHLDRTTAVQVKLTITRFILFVSTYFCFSHILISHSKFVENKRKYNVDN